MTHTHGPGSAPAPRRTDALRNRERLLAAAQEVFVEAGPGASLNEIARRAGVGPGTLYRHFPNRHALLTAVLRDRIDALRAQAETLLRTETPDDALAHWLHALLTHARVNHGMVSTVMIEEPVTPGLDCHQVILDAATALLTRAQRQGTARTDLTADDLLQLVAGIALATARRTDADQPERLMNLVLDAAYGRAHPRESSPGVRG
ncbi:TetR/AcrR family transcriptional regulator [Streptomyces sp. TRM68367]|uniref:TetR/AcrR family transcriptional regulator n=1 Tax=Streptomyces sp. TRM68367 TaxID=2758415 RepID=UPI00165AB391|nr:TetR/AcrR family transcriptional regulator [Streptomyces sp. TRM68367]MBC9727625.1 TetR/AcrR family transcriptional regulator [Streptomyces sp. TRM68367]